MVAPALPQQHAGLAGRARVQTPHHQRPGSSSSRCRSRRLVCGAAKREKSAYEPLEKAVRVLNRVIAIGERAGWGAEHRGGAKGAKPAAAAAPAGASTGPERWVQFAAAAASHLAVEQPQQGGSSYAAPQVPAAAATPASSSNNSGLAPSSGGGSRLLRDYLSLPVDQYSLLDPKWITREEGGSFRFSIPLQELVGVDLQPEICIAVHPDPRGGRVTLAGSRAALGSPEIDQAFKLSVVGLLSQRQRRRLPRMPQPPDHLPGRPVYRLRRWAARARGRTWPSDLPAAADAAALVAADADDAAAAAAAESYAAVAAAQEGEAAQMAGLAAAAERQLEELEQANVLGSSGSSSEEEQVGLGGSSDEGPAVSAVLTSSAPLPDEHVYISHDGEDEDEFHSSEDDDEAAAAAALQAAAASLPALPAAERSVASTAASAGGSTQQQQQHPAVLHCRVNVTIAVRVPTPLRVVPNALLGYAGSLLLRAVLAAALPNFVSLLGRDYQRWAAGEGQGPGGSRDLDAPVGELFADAAAAVASGRQRQAAAAAAAAEQ